MKEAIVVRGRGVRQTIGNQTRVATAIPERWRAIFSWGRRVMLRCQYVSILFYSIILCCAILPCSSGSEAAPFLVVAGCVCCLFSSHRAS